MKYVVWFIVSLALVLSFLLAAAGDCVVCYCEDDSQFDQSLESVFEDDSILPHRRDGLNALHT